MADLVSNIESLISLRYPASFLRLPLPHPTLRQQPIHVRPVPRLLLQTMRDQLFQLMADNFVGHIYSIVYDLD